VLETDPAFLDRVNIGDVWILEDAATVTAA
jgi:hypothetical protein